MFAEFADLRYDILLDCNRGCFLENFLHEKPAQACRPGGWMLKNESNISVFSYVVTRKNHTFAKRRVFWLCDADKNRRALVSKVRFGGCDLECRIQGDGRAMEGPFLFRVFFGQTCPISAPQCGHPNHEFFFFFDESLSMQMVCRETVQPCGH